MLQPVTHERSDQLGLQHPRGQGEPDGRENPFTYFWSAYVKKSKDDRYERVYYPIHSEEVRTTLSPLSLSLSAKHTGLPRTQPPHTQNSPFARACRCVQEPVELVLLCIISSIDVANKLLVDAVGAHCYVSRVEVKDYVYQSNKLDDWVDQKAIPALTKLSDKVSEKFKEVTQRR